MPIDLITSSNLTQGLHVPLVYVNNLPGASMLFSSMLLTITWIGITLGVYLAQLKNNNRDDFFAANATGGFITIVLATLLNLIPGMMNMLVYAIVLVLGVFSVISFLFHMKEQ